MVKQTKITFPFAQNITGGGYCAGYNITHTKYYQYALCINSYTILKAYS